MTLSPERTVTDEVTDFLGSAPTLEEIVAYKLPDVLQAQAHHLLDKNREGQLAESERDQLEEFRRMDHILILVKAKARLKLKSR